MVSCVNNYLNLSIEKNPSVAGKILDEIWSGKLGIDLRLFSPIAHDVGMGLIDRGIGLSSAIHVCGQSFKGACVHGAVMEYIDKNFSPHPTSTMFIHICDSILSDSGGKQYEDCVHAVGHELRAKLTGPNSAIIEQCNFFANNDRNACASGVLMEASKGNDGIGYHSDNVVGKIAFDCSGLEDQYEFGCYSSIGSYRQYEANSESFATTFDFCASLPVKQQTYCFVGVDERLLMAESGDVDKAENFCRSLPRSQIVGCLMVKNMNLSNLE